MPSEKKPMSFRMTEKEKKAFDSIVDVMGCSRTEALTKILHEWAELKGVTLSSELHTLNMHCSLIEQCSEEGLKGTTLDEVKIKRDSINEEFLKVKDIEHIFDRDK